MHRIKDSAREKALKIAGWAVAKKAIKPAVLNVKNNSGIWDYFVICSADNERHAKAVHDEVVKRALSDSIAIHHQEKDTVNEWLLIDFNDVLFHVFSETARVYYNIERLWNDAKRVRIVKNKEK